MEIKDALGFGKMLPFDKLCDMVSGAFGRFTKAYFERKDVDTDVYRIKRLAEARAEAIKIVGTAVKDNFEGAGNIEYNDNAIKINSPDPTSMEAKSSVNVVQGLATRAADRASFQQTQKQANIENVTAIAAEELNQEEFVTDEPVDQDWTTRFFNIVEDISNKEMQSIWGKILAGELRKPKTYSLRTLELLRNLSEKEARTFSKVAEFALSFNGDHYIFKTNSSNFLKEKYEINYSDFAILIEVGLLQPATDTVLHIDRLPRDKDLYLLAGNYVFVARVTADTKPTAAPIYVFTTAGNELMTLVKPNTPMEYLVEIAKSLKATEVEVKYSTITNREGGEIRYQQPLQDFQ